MFWISHGEVPSIWSVKSLPSPLWCRNKIKECCSGLNVVCLCNVEAPNVTGRYFSMWKHLSLQDKVVTLSDYIVPPFPVRFQAIQGVLQSVFCVICHQAGSLTIFFILFPHKWSQPGGQGPPNFQSHKQKCIFIKLTIKVCVSCSVRCPGTSTASSPHLMVSLFLCSYRSKARGESRTLDWRWVSSKSP